MQSRTDGTDFEIYVQDTVAETKKLRNTVSKENGKASKFGQPYCSAVDQTLGMTNALTVWMTRNSAIPERFSIPDPSLKSQPELRPR